jgi:hypothetical protein
MTLLVCVFEVTAAALILYRARRIVQGGEKVQRNSLLGCVLQQGMYNQGSFPLNYIKFQQEYCIFGKYSQDQGQLHG